MALIGSYSKIFVSLQALIKFKLVLIRQVHISLGKNFILTTEIKENEVNYQELVGVLNTYGFTKEINFERFLLETMVNKIEIDIIQFI